MITEVKTFDDLMYLLTAMYVHEPGCPVPGAMRRGESVMCTCEQSIEAREKALAFMQDQTEDNWPCYPYLPLRHAIRKDSHVPGINELGYLAAGYGPRVYVGTFQTPEPDKYCEVITRIENHDSFEDVLAAGWIVD